jgi:hypothetical protein
VFDADPAAIFGAIRFLSVELDQIEAKSNSYKRDSRNEYRLSWLEFPKTAKFTCRKSRYIPLALDGF